MAKKPNRQSNTAKQPAAAPKVLLLGLGEDTLAGRRVRAILEELKLPAVTLSPLEAGQTVGYLAGLEGFSSQNAPLKANAASVPFLLMAGLSEAQQTKLLTAMAGDGIHIPLKAVVTETNRYWTLGQLLAEISREHAFMNRTGGQALPGLHTPANGADK